MLAFSDIIDFLLSLLSDESARAEYEQDPEGTLHRAGLDGVTAQDIRDARLQLADVGAVHRTDDGPSAHHGDDPVREIGYTTRHYAADEHAQHASIDHGTVITIDDRDTVFFQSISDDDVTVTDNSVEITDAFNVDASDDDLVAIQDNDTTVTDDDVVINADDSFNTDDSFNEDNDLVAIQDNDVNGGDGAVDVNLPVADDPEPADPEPVDPEPVDPEPGDAEPVDADGAEPGVDDVAPVG